jgi:signal transduction histidine kinase
MGTELGLARFDPRSETFSYFDTRDGLVIGEASTCFQNPLGEMLFGGSQGLNTFFPDQIPDNPKPPAVAVTALNLKNQPLRTHLLPDEQIKLSYRENYLSFDFAALDYTAPAKNQYAYRMEGLEADWVDAGTRRHADYPDLKPGTYTFCVKASNNSGVWNEQVAAVHITITPPFWQTWWFLGLLGVGFLGVIAGGVRLRLKGVEARRRELEIQVADRTAELSQANVALEVEIAERIQVEEALRQSEREKAIVDERNRLARELHDSVAQSMYGVTLLAEVASQLLASGRTDQVAGYLGGLKETAKDSLAEMRLLIYELRPPVLEEEGLAAALQARLEAVEGRAGLETELKLDGKLSLNPEVEETLFRIAQEALNNALKHGHAHRIVVSLGQAGQRVVLEVADDGAGFDPAAARRSGGLGLRGMEERAAEIGARLEIESAAGSGTRVRVVWEGGTG